VPGTIIWTILSILADAGVFIVIFYTLKRLFNYVRIVAGYFFGSDIVDAFRKIAGARGLLEKVENDCKEELTYLNKKDWTMAGIYWDKITKQVKLFGDFPEERKEWI
jgi:hypothetical protein